MAKVELKQISMRYEKKLILEKLNLQIDHGELLVLLGESGCGKTTILKIIAGIIQPESGSLSVDDIDITSTSPQQRKIGYVPQAQVLFPHMNVKDNIAFGLEARKLEKKEIERKLESISKLIEIEDLLDRYPSELSGGQKQRVALARAMAIEPKILLLDEPLSSIDATGRESLALIIKRIQKETETTTLYVTHNGDEARLISDRVAIIYDGQIQQIGKVHQVEVTPRNYLIAKIMGSDNIWPILHTKKETQKINLSTSIGDFPLLKEQNKKLTGIRIPSTSMKLSKQGLNPSKTKTMPVFVKTILEKNQDIVRVIFDFKNSPSEYIKVDLRRDELEIDLVPEKEYKIYLNLDEIVFL